MNIQTPVSSHIIHLHEDVLVYFSYEEKLSYVNLVKFGRKMK